MKVITLPQPLAALVVAGVKQLDARFVGTKHRGLLGIHSSARRLTVGEFGWDAFMRKDVRDHMRAQGWTDPESLPYGTVMGTVQLVDVVTVPEARGGGLLTSWELSLGTYVDGRRVWCFQDAKRYRVEISATAPSRGHLWDWDRPFSPPPLGGA